jgi:hypothetical protein
MATTRPRVCRFGDDPEVTAATDSPSPMASVPESSLLEQQLQDAMLAPPGTQSSVAVPFGMLKQGFRYAVDLGAPSVALFPDPTHPPAPCMRVSTVPRVLLTLTCENPGPYHDVVLLHAESGAVVEVGGKEAYVNHVYTELLAAGNGHGVAQGPGHARMPAVRPPARVRGRCGSGVFPRC